MYPFQNRFDDVFVLVPSLEESIVGLEVNNNLNRLSACTRPGRSLKGSGNRLILEQSISSFNLCPEAMPEVENIPESNSFQRFNFLPWNMETGDSSQSMSINNHESSWSIKLVAERLLSLGLRQFFSGSRVGRECCQPLCLACSSYSFAQNPDTDQRWLYRDREKPPDKVMMNKVLCSRTGSIRRFWREIFDLWLTEGLSNRTGSMLSLMSGLSSRTGSRTIYHDGRGECFRNRTGSTYETVHVLSDRTGPENVMEFALMVGSYDTGDHADFAKEKDKELAWSDTVAPLWYCQQETYPAFLRAHRQWKKVCKWSEPYADPANRVFLQEYFFPYFARKYHAKSYF